MRKTVLLLFLITVLGGILRFYELGEVPKALHRDEAFWGYNAYSVLKTGYDMTGDFLPLHLKSFLYSPSFYIYFSIPFISLFGLNEFSVRGASALFGTFTIPVLFFLLIFLFEKSKRREFIALSSALILALLPWHINLSRLATENTIVTFFIILATVLFIYSFSKKSLFYLVISYLLFFLTFFIYQMPRSFLIFYVPLLYFCFASKSQFRKNTIIHVFLFLLFIILPLIIILKSQELSLRIRTVSIFGTPETILKIDEQRREEYLQDASLIASKVFHNKVVYYAKTATENYFSHFSFEFYFTDKGLPDRYRIPLSPIIFISLHPFILYGGYLCIRKGRVGVYILVSILLIPVGSALTFDDVPNLQRTMPLSIFYSILAGYGFVSFLSKDIKVSKYKINLLITILFFAVFSFEFFSYLRQYYAHSSWYRPWYRNDGYKELMTEVKNYPDKKIIMTNRESAPAIFTLFYTSYDPVLYQKLSKQHMNLHYDLMAFDGYEFSEEECPLRFNEKEDALTGKKDVIYVNSSLCKIPEGTKLLKTIKRTDGSDVFYVLMHEN